MQIPKSFLFVCAAAYCMALQPLRAADADTDSKLREALEKKLDELQTQPPATAPQPKKEAPAPELKTMALVAGQAVVVASNVNVRGQAKLKSEVVTQITKGQSVTVLEEIVRNDSGPDEPSAWAKITLPPGAHVWINSSFINATNKTVLPEKLNLRSGPGENYSVIGILQRGDALKEVTTQGEWTEIEAPTSAYAFVATQYLKQEASAPPTPTPAPPEPPPTPKTVAVAPPVAPAAQPPPAPAVSAPPPAGGRPTPPAQWTPPPVARPSQKPAAAPAPAVQSTAKPVLTAPPPVDSETIAKAREAMRQKMAEMETQSAPAAAIPAQPVPAVQPMPAAVAPAPAPAPAAAAPPVIAQPAPAPTPVPAPTVQAPPVVVQPAPAPAPAVQTAPQATLAAPTPVDSETIAKAREALRQKMKELEAQPPAEATTVTPAGTKTTPETKPIATQSQSSPAQSEAKPMAEKPPKKAGKVTGASAFPPLAAPPPSVSADKDQRLQKLLRKYRADQITPEEYHQQRAKILAEP
jgi:uncharacterized protein YgiM (DUF1202 family)